MTTTLDATLRPPVGRRRELWDTSIYVLWIVVVGYVIFDPPAAVTTPLAAPLRVVSEQQLGWAVTGAALIGVSCSYRATCTQVGYVVVRVACLFMAANFAVGSVLIGLDIASSAYAWMPSWLDTIPELVPRTDIDRAIRAGLIYSMVFGWAARRLARDNRAWWEFPGDGR